MTTLQKSATLSSSHRKSQAEMIDEQINELCEATGLIKSHLLKVIGLYPPLWAQRKKFPNGLTAKEREDLESWLRTKGEQLAKFKIGDNPLADITRLHEDFGLFKKRMLDQLSITFETLERKNQISDEKKSKLESELKKISAILASFSMSVKP